MKIIAIIPARRHSTRLPGKPLLKIRDREMILHVADRASRAKTLSEVHIATDDAEIAEVVARAGYSACLTRADHATGTDRIAEAASKLTADIIVNIQGDEPMIEPDMIDEAVRPFLTDTALLMGTLKAPIRDPSEIFDPNCVKVVVDERDFAIYFSRSPIPFIRGSMDFKNGLLNFSEKALIPFYKHIGLYVYRREFLFRFAGMAPGRLEKLEMLEQLRALEAGIRIKAPTTLHDTVSVDTPEDYEKVKRLMENGA